MISPVIVKTPILPPYCEKEILRYAASGADENTKVVLYECLKEAEAALSPRVCYRILPVLIQGDTVSFELFTLSSQDLAKNLKDADKALLFAATVGVGIDRLVTKYSYLSPVKALLFQAIGSERVEALCDVFCQEIKKELQCSAFPRFSPGYGDLALSTQKDIFAVLGCSKHLGIALGDSLLMTPSKSVTAFMGLKK